MSNNHFYTEEQKTWLRDNYPLLPIRALTEQFNALFKTALSKVALHGSLQRYGIKSGRTGCFQKGSVPFNKGLKGLNHSPATQFKKGNRPHGSLPVNAEIVRGGGYIWVKVAEPNRWKEKHRVIWEAAYGPVPKGFALLFIDQDKANIELANLKLVERKLLLRINLNGYRKMHDTLKPTVLALSALEVVAGDWDGGINRHRGPRKSTNKTVNCETI